MILEKLKSNSFLVSILFACFILLSTIYCDTYFESYEGFFTAALSGKLTPGTDYNHLYFMAHLGWFSDLYASLSRYFSGAPIVSYFEYVYLTISLIICLYIFLKHVGKYSIFMIVPIILLFVEHFIILNYSRVSILISSTSLLLFLDTSLTKNRNYIIKILVSILFWTIGLYMRIETAIFCLAMFFPIFLYFRYSKSIKYVLIQLFIYFILSTTILSFYTINCIDKSNDFYLQIEPECEYEIMVKQNYKGQNEMKTEFDSLRYEAIIKGFWGDADIIPASFIKNLINEEKTGVFYLKSATDYINTFTKFYDDYKTYIIVYILVSLILLIQIGLRRKFLFYFAYQIYSFSLIVFIALQLKYADRVTVPLFGISITIQLYLFLLVTNKSKINLNKSLLFYSILSSLIGNNLYYNVKILSDENTVYSQVADEIKKAFNGKTLVVNGEVLTVLINQYKPLQNIDLSNYKQIFIHDNLAFNTIPPYKDYLEKSLKCNAENYKSLYEALKRNDSTSVFVLTEERKDFLQKYLFKIHGSHYTWEEIQAYKIDFLEDKYIYLTKNRFYTLKNNAVMFNANSER